MMGKISFFLGLQISQSPKGIFINQSKYALESLKKYGFESCDPVDTPMVEKSTVDKDKEGKVVDPSHYREQVENGVIELYFVNTEYQLADLFTKALGWDRIEFLTTKLGMRSFMPEMLKKLMNKEEETVATTIEQQVTLDEALVPSAQRLRIGRSNFRLPSDIQSKEFTLEVVYDVLRRSPFFKAFLVTADAMTYVHQHSIRFKMDTRKNIVDLEAFREMLHISPRVLGQSFTKLPFEEEILEFLRLTAAAKGKQPARVTSPTDPSDVKRTEAEQLKIEEISKIDEQEAIKSGEGDDEETKSDRESEEEETREEVEESFDPIPRTPEDSEDDGNGEEDQGLRISEEERMHEEEEAYELYRD
nr:uncharacterized mitochondrial protein AtMg00810-like [Tanacetum cinerariifolium]